VALCQSAVSPYLVHPAKPYRRENIKAPEELQQIREMAWAVGMKQRLSLPDLWRRRVERAKPIILDTQPHEHVRKLRSRGSASCSPRSPTSALPKSNQVPSPDRAEQGAEGRRGSGAKKEGRGDEGASRGDQSVADDYSTHFNEEEEEEGAKGHESARQKEEPALQSAAEPAPRPAQVAYGIPELEVATPPPEVCVWCVSCLCVCNVRMTQAALPVWRCLELGGA
jgi:hypothetical protein